jgi:putative DNA primase/helicase
MGMRGDATASGTTRVFRMPRTQEEADRRLEEVTKVRRKTNVLPKSEKPNTDEPGVKVVEDKVRKPKKPKPKSKSKASAKSKPEPVVGPHWSNQLTRKRSGEPYGSRANVATVIAHTTPDLLAFNELTGEVIKTKPTVGSKTFRPSKALRRAGAWTDHDTVLLAAWLEKEHDMVCELPVVRDGLSIEARRHAFHPIRDYLDAQVWDQTPRLDTWLVRFAFTKDTPYVRAVSSKWVISAVARAYEPGCKADHVLIIEGDQRSGKTTLFETLCGNPAWFTSTHLELGSKDSMQTIACKWIVELAELDSLNRTEWARVKAFLTTRVDTYRRSYGREVEDQRRRVVFAGTTNESGGYLRDHTGNGRFWPVWSGATVFQKVDIVELAKERDQIWAEAVARYRAGEPWYLTDEKLLRSAIREQDKRRNLDPWEGRIQRFLAKSTTREKGTTTLEILAQLGISIKDTDRGHEMRVGSILRAANWFRRRAQRSGARVYRFFPKN